MADQYQVAIERGAVKMLGCPIGRDRQMVEHLLSAQVDKHRQFLDFSNTEQCQRR